MKRKLEKENVKAAKPKVRKDEVIDRKERVVDSSDERSMIIEQNRLLRIRQKRKNRWKRRTGVGILMLCAAGGIWYLLWGRKLIQTSESGAVQVTASPEQEIVYARLDSLKGNEITYTVAKEHEQTGTDKTGTDKAVTDKTRTEQPETGKTEKRTEEGSGGPGGAMPGDSGGIMNGAPDGVMSGMQNNTGDFTYNNTVYRLTEETGQDMIPVGTPVTTRLGTVTTFSRLAAGDYVALVMEEDGGKRVIAAVYIVG